MDFPDAYDPLNYCRGCGFDFTSLDAFDRHLQGTPEHREPCLGVDLRNIGLEPRVTKLGVERWGIPVTAEKRAQLEALRAA